MDDSIKRWMPNPVQTLAFFYKSLKDEISKKNAPKGQFDTEEIWYIAELLTKFSHSSHTMLGMSTLVDLPQLLKFLSKTPPLNTPEALESVAQGVLFVNGFFRDGVRGRYRYDVEFF